MAQKPLTTAKMYTAAWTEKDEAILLDLLHRKVSEMQWEIKDADSPYVRRRLRAKRKEYKAMIETIESGNYNPDIVRAEFATADAYRASSGMRPITDGKSKYIDTYSEIDFDYNRYFAKTRYYGTALPLLTIILTVIFLFVLLSSAILPASVHRELQDSLWESETFSADSPYFTLGGIAYFRLDDGEEDFIIPNDGNWPNGVYENPSMAPAQGEAWRNTEGNYPDTVYLHRDLGMVAVEITTVDVLRALFRTPAMSDTRVDFIEDLDAMQGRSWYYYKYIRDRADRISIEKDAEGNYSSANIVRHIATYGTIVFLVATLVCAVLTIIFGIGQLFSYTSRRVHATTILTLIFAILTLICPIFVDIPDLAKETVPIAISDYFNFSWGNFIYSETATINFNPLMFLLLLLPFITVLLPFFFKNREAKQVTMVPKGNRKHTYPGQTKATKPGQERTVASKKGEEPPARGSKKAYNANTPYRRPDERK